MAKIKQQSLAFAPDVAAEMTRWLSHLGAERRMSPKTLEAYQRDVAQFLAFVAEHRGGTPTLKDLARLTPQDVRAFMAARRAAGIGGRSLMRGLAGAGPLARLPEPNWQSKGGPPSPRRGPEGKKNFPPPPPPGAAEPHNTPP